MLAFREFRVRYNPATSRPILQSTYMNTLWEEASLTADIPPTKEGDGKQHGVHAVLPSSPRNQFLTQTDKPGDYWWYSIPFQLRAFAAVDLSGVVQIHTDGVARAEHCRILALRLAPLPEGRWCKCGVLRICHGPASQEAWWKLRTPCADGRCGSEQVSQYHTLVIEGSTTLAEVQAALLGWYEVVALGEDEGPWARPKAAE